MHEDIDPELYRAAENACKSAYSPYSKIMVGAALRAQDGKIFSGTNFENASYSLTNCAERAALGAALLEWKDRKKPIYTELLILNSTNTPMPPCGACRQVLYEMNPNAIITFKSETGWISKKAWELLPLGFSLKEKT